MCKMDSDEETVYVGAKILVKFHYLGLCAVKDSVMQRVSVE